MCLVRRKCANAYYTGLQPHTFILPPRAPHALVQVRRARTCSRTCTSMDCTRSVKARMALARDISNAPTLPSLDYTPHLARAGTCITDQCWSVNAYFTRLPS